MDGVISTRSFSVTPTACMNVTDPCGVTIRPSDPSTTNANVVRPVGALARFHGYPVIGDCMSMRLIDRKLLEEVDGPMLRHGQQEMHGRALTLPTSPKDHPDKELLAARWDLFARR